MDTQKRVHWVCHVDETTAPEKAQYDMIIGMDLMVEIGIFIDTGARLICWGENSVPLKERGLLSNENTLHELYHMSLEPLLRSRRMTSTYSGC